MLQTVALGCLATLARVEAFAQHLRARSDHNENHALRQKEQLTMQARCRRRLSPAGFLPDADLPDDAYYTELRKLIVGSCGQACDIVTSKGAGRFFDTVIKEAQCQSLFTANMTLLDGLSNRWPGPARIPDPMRADFTMGNSSMHVEDNYLHENAGNKALTWSQDTLDDYIAQFAERNFSATTYGSVDTAMIHDLIMKHKSELENKHCAVLGSQSPWLEALLLLAGVLRITTIEYSDIRSTHPQIQTMHPSDWASWHEQQEELFDCVFSYSSLEHAGLGRYGDIVNPWGDFIAMGKLSCSTKDGGLLFIGYPTSAEDSIAWNAHRYYGPKRWAQMLANTEQLEYEHPPEASYGQGMVVARKLDPVQMLSGR